MSLSAEEEALLSELTTETTETTVEDMEKVRKMVTDFKNGKVTEIEGATDLIDLTMSIGAPVPSILFQDILAACDINANMKDYYSTKLKELIPSDVGCVKTEPFADIKTGGKAVGIIVYKEIDHDNTKNHHIETELDNFLRHITKSKALQKKYRPMIEKQLQQVIKNGHGIYCHMREKCETIFKAMEGKYPEGFDPDELQYDPTRAEFSLKLENTRRVGIFIEVHPLS